MTQPLIDTQAFLWITASLPVMILALGYLWWYRARMIRQAFIRSFNNPVTLLSERQLDGPLFKLQQFATIDTCFRHRDDVSVFFMKDFMSGINRYKYYLGIEFINWNKDNRKPEEIFGSGELINRYTDPYGLNLKASPLHDLDIKLDIPEGYSILEITNDNLYVIYPLPDFSGLGPVDRVKKWLNDNISSLDLQ